MPTDVEWDSELDRTMVGKCGIMFILMTMQEISHHETVMLQS